MDPYLVRLGCRSPYLTPWRSCTVWGRLAWIVADGRLPEWNIATWIGYTLKNSPLLVVGDAFPANAVPVPALALAKTGGQDKKPKTLPWDEWLELCRTGVWPSPPPRPHAAPAVERSHVVLSRATGAALLLDDPNRADKQRGQLRTEVGWQPESLLLVAQAASALGQRGLTTLFEELCKDGWGQGRTYGYGQVELQGIEELRRPQSTGWVTTLGHCHPTDDMPQNGYWRWVGVPVRPHDLQTRQAPKEYFATMLLPGASFATGSETLGRAVELPEQPQALHVGITPTWPVAGAADG